MKVLCGPSFRKTIEKSKKMQNTALDNSADSKCSKCDNKATVLTKSDAVCDSCFVRRIENKIRRQFELVRPNLQGRKSKRAMLAISGGISSMAMLETANYLSKYRDDNYRPMFDELLAVHFQWGTDSAVAKTIEESISKNYPKCPFKVIGEAELLNRTIATDSRGNIEINADNEKFNPEVISSLASRQDLLYRIRDKLLVSYARKANCDTIVFGDSGTTIAARVLELVAEGRGFAIPWYTSVCSKLPNCDTFLLRPLREVLSSDLKSYMNIKGLAFCDSLIEARPNTIHGVTESYFSSLNDTFPSLVSTVVKMSSKLHVPSTEAICTICNLPMQEDAETWLQKTTVEHPDSVEGIKNQNVCYGCSVSLKSLKGTLHIPDIEKEGI